MQNTLTVFLFKKLKRALHAEHETCGDSILHLLLLTLFVSPPAVTNDVLSYL